MAVSLIVHLGLQASLVRVLSEVAIALSRVREEGNLSFLA